MYVLQLAPWIIGPFITYDEACNYREERAAGQGIVIYMVDKDTISGLIKLHVTEPNGPSNNT